MHIEFVWDGSHLIQERNEHNIYTYIYTHPNSYEPLAQINENGEEHYYHCDQIGAPRELTNQNGELCWYASYKGWGELQGEHNLKGVHQPIRLQNQYFDKETGLHYNFFRYYEPTIGRFTTQDPIGLAGGENLYRFAKSVQNWVDVVGLEASSCSQKILEAANSLNNDNRYSYSESYSLMSTLTNRWNKKTNKCNLFIEDVLKKADISPPQRKGGNIFINKPITAGEWADPDSKVPGFRRVAIPEPGDIVAVSHNYSDATGHVAVVKSYDKSNRRGTTIGAGSETGSHTTSWPWDGSSTQGRYIYRRCEE